MTDIRKFENLWAQVEGLLIPFEGLASQIYILDLPINSGSWCVDQYLEAVSNPRWMVFQSVGLGSGEVSSLDAQARKKIGATLTEGHFHVISGKIHGTRGLDLWLVPNDEKTTFDAELVFWADEWFSASQDRKENVASFSSLINIVERIRSISPNCECGLSASEYGDPREDRYEKWTVFW